MCNASASIAVIDKTTTNKNKTVLTLASKYHVIKTYFSFGLLILIKPQCI